ncbi:phosphonate metabolism protein/1,5-bisphosphokinase (PRPP-forming) PhnN [Litoreibacter roseus]|uniref:Ribose 1,5-bisphosphate phosphokinase PhnN n=1 Tax=Litoreibacter roseus TaxID=2601869 RepID=A0A6N6JIE7_9RHOB|nr:phosphonate metabolism protein/1,5-bisphosphokinase (PRPP-forming) PhnN [Litoreibacter roseus]GFE66133.1 ribose 1,5-bisphosphate phosphokinase PhnN [Litoreibacter roseus]
MTGRFIAVVGPSGVGKDTVMAALAKADPRLHIVRRVITRDPEAGGEEFDAATVEEFNRMVADDAFALHWGAHDLNYGIPASVDDLLRENDALANLSRGVLDQARMRFDDVLVLALTADREVLARRLAARGRESAPDIAKRLDRAGCALPSDIEVITIDNSGPLENTVSHAISALYPESVYR